MIATSSNSAADTNAPLRGVAPNLAHALEGIWRVSCMRAWARKQWISGLWTAAVLTGLVYLQAGFGNDDRYYGWIVRVYLTMLIPIMSFIAGASAIREDMKSGGVDYLLTRPVTRPVFVIARFCSHLICTQVTSLLMFGALMGAGVHQGVGDLAEHGPLLWFGQAAGITVFMALGFFFGSFTARYVVLAVNYAAIVEIGLGNIDIALSKLSMLRHLKACLAPLNPEAAVTLVPQSALVTAGFLAIFTVVWVGLAAFFFSLQEFAGQRPKDP